MVLTRTFFPQGFNFSPLFFCLSLFLLSKPTDEVASRLRRAMPLISPAHVSCFHIGRRVNAVFFGCCSVCLSMSSACFWRSSSSSSFSFSSSSSLRVGFQNPFLGASFFLLSCCALVFLGVFCLCFAYLFGFFFAPEMLGKKHLLLIRLGFRNPFSGANFCFGGLVAALCFSVVFLLCFCMLVVFSPRMLGFRERTLVFVVLLLPCVFRWCFCLLFA